MDSMESRGQEGRDVKEVLDKFYRGSGKLRVYGREHGVSSPSFEIVPANDRDVHEV